MVSSYNPLYGRQGGVDRVMDRGRVRCRSSCSEAPSQVGRAMSPLLLTMFPTGRSLDGRCHKCAMLKATGLFSWGWESCRMAQAGGGEEQDGGWRFVW